MSTRADLVQRLLWQRINQRFFCHTGWVWDDSVKKAVPCMALQGPMNKSKQTRLTQYWRKCKELSSPKGLQAVKGDLVPLAAMGWGERQELGGERQWVCITSTTLLQGASTGNLTEMHTALNHPVISPTSTPHQAQSLCLQPHSEGPECCLEFRVRCQCCKP